MEEEFENKEKISIEYPKNYEKIIDFKIHRLEKEYQETINSNFKEEDLKNIPDFDSDSESENENENSKNENVENGENLNGYQQCINNDDEFVEVLEDENDDKEDLVKK